ncbi:MAG TPA: VanZ family protein [Rhodoferax sp.]|nr:VanZ family protein [Rhodoferax sp.]HRA13420.1 VanZ family protein [Giesbergeria sp.]
MPLPALTQVPPGFARPSFWALLLCVTVLSLLPTDYLPPQIFSLWDKAQHALAFAALAALGLQAYPHRRWRVLAGLLVFGGLIELAQAATGWRYGEWADWLADAVGLALGMALAESLQRRVNQA